jgi:hypothetical protein
MHLSLWLTLVLAKRQIEEALLSREEKPGSYMIRLVVRDDEGQLMAAGNGAVEIL